MKGPVKHRRGPVKTRHSDADEVYPRVLQSLLRQAKARGLDHDQLKLVARSWKATGGRCEFCLGSPATVVELNHQTGEMLGLTCAGCTTADIREQQ